MFNIAREFMCRKALFYWGDHMSVDWYLMTEKPFFNSGFEHDEHFAFAYDGFNEILDTTALGDEVTFYYNGIINEENSFRTKAIVQNNSTDVIDNDKVKQILCNIGTLEYGVYVYYKGKYFLVTDVPGDNKFYGKAIMQQCNYLLRWINNVGKIIEQWCIFKNVTKDYATGLSEGKKLILGTMTASLYLPKNSETVKLNMNDRLIIDDYEFGQLYFPAVYKITKLNLIQKTDLRNSLYIYTLEDTQYNIDQDNKELMIADYFNRIKVYDIDVISPSYIEIRVGDTFDIKAKVTINGKYSDEEIAYRGSDNTIAYIDGNTVTGVKVGSAIIYIESNGVIKEIRISVVNAVRRFQNASHIEFSGSTEMKIGLSKKFEALFFDANGQQTRDFPMWSIVDEYGNAPDFIESKTEGNAIWLRSSTIDWVIGRQITLILSGSGGLAEDRVQLTITSLT